MQKNRYVRKNISILSSGRRIRTYVLQDMSLSWSLSRHPAKSIVGIEPTYPAWKAGVITIIPYEHIYNLLVGVARFELTTSWSQIKRTAKLSYTPIIIAVAGLEPTYHTVWRCCVAITLYCNEISLMGLEPTCCFQRTIKSRVPYQLGDRELNNILFSIFLFSFLHDNHLLIF